MSRSRLIIMIITLLFAWVLPTQAIPVVSTAPVLQDTRIYISGITATITIQSYGYAAHEVVRIDKVAEEVNLDPNGSSTYRYSEVFELTADWTGTLYFVDGFAAVNSRYTYTFTRPSGAQLTVPVITQQVQTDVPAYTIDCGPLTLPSRLQIGSEGVALAFQPGYTHATSDLMVSDLTNIEIYRGYGFRVLNGPVCDGQGGLWWKVVTSAQNYTWDQVMYVREFSGTNYLLQPSGVLATVETNRLLPGNTTYWTPDSDRFRVNIRTDPTWCQDGGKDIAPVITQASAGERYVVTHITSDFRWVRVALANGSFGWVSTHLGSVNFFVPYLAYGNIDGIFVAPPLVWDPIPTRVSCE